MPLPIKIELAFSFLSYCRGVEIGPVPSAPAQDWKPEYGRPLTAREKQIKDLALQTVAEYFNTEGFGEVPEEPVHPMAAFMAHVAGGRQEEPPEPPAEPPGSTVAAPEPPPGTSGDEVKPPEPEKVNAS